MQEDEIEDNLPDVCWICYACGEINYNLNQDECPECGEEREEGEE